MLLSLDLYIFLKNYYHINVGVWPLEAVTRNVKREEVRIGFEKKMSEVELNQTLV